MAFGDNGTTRILGRGTMALKGNAKAQEVLYVDGLKHDIISVGQICDANHNITFYFYHCEIRRNDSHIIIGKCS